MKEVGPRCSRRAETEMRGGAACRLGHSPAFVVSAVDNTGIYGPQEQRRTILMGIYSKTEVD